MKKKKAVKTPQSVLEKKRKLFERAKEKIGLVETRRGNTAIRIRDAQTRLNALLAKHNEEDNELYDAKESAERAEKAVKAEAEKEAMPPMIKNTGEERVIFRTFSVLGPYVNDDCYDKKPEVNWDRTAKMDPTKGDEITKPSDMVGVWATRREPVTLLIRSDGSELVGGIARFIEDETGTDMDEWTCLGYGPAARASEVAEGPYVSVCFK